MKSPRPTHRERTRRAFGAYIELVDTADWVRRQLAGPLAYLDLTVNEFRLLDMVRRQGRMGVIQAAEKGGWRVQFVHKLAGRLEAAGWLRRELVARTPAEVRPTRLPKAKRGRPRRGRKVLIVSLTAEGQRLIETALPRQTKLVKSLMHVLDMREQDSLGRLCRKLREGDPVKYFGEIRMEDAEEDLMV
jgi:DNA-binding MarR family transcriptional regulator